jgi:putative Mn2+ efflux pump MntP
MAFSGNDLVNFIGVPLAGFEAFNLFQSNGGQDLLMSGLSAKVHTPTIFLLVAGLVMVITIWLSKKARTVTETELNLARQDEGIERWSSSTFARLLVGRAVGSSTFFSNILPESLINTMRKRFDQSEYNKKIQQQKNPPMFDLIRASVNLTVASILISFATSFKLPLSTTYVTFMVAMGTSLADRAWGRDSAVYRITGVFTVIGGWFMTALVAFTVAFVIALFISWAKFIAVVILILVAVFTLVKSTKKHNDKVSAKTEKEDVADTADKVMARCRVSLSNVLVDVMSIFSKSIDGLKNEDRKSLRKQWQLTKDIDKRVKEQKDKVHIIISELQQDSIETGHFYTQVVDYQRELLHDLSFMLEPILNHVENHHKSILPVQADELSKLVDGVAIYFNKLQSVVFEKTFDQLDDVIEIQSLLIRDIECNVKSQIKRIKNKEVGTRNSMLYMNILTEIKNMLLNALNMVKSQRDFVSK